MKMKEYGVIIINDDGKIMTVRVEAKDRMHAFYVAAKDYPFEFDAVCSFRWTKRHLLEYPGESLVDRSTILEQMEVFGK